MFFQDPGATFANIGRALRPAGRLVMMTWQARERNEWTDHHPPILSGPEAVVDAVSEGPDGSRSPTRRP